MELVAVIATSVTPFPMVIVGELFIGSLKVAVIVTVSVPLRVLFPSLFVRPLSVGTVVSTTKVEVTVAEFPAES